eukprot:m.263211 g.263211  ORF g.263211 m.263211 type:complete len:207 (+) comp26842_c0_seq1:18-638(+)
MAPKRNNIVPNGHFKKDWQRYVTCHFNQAGKKVRRRTKRTKKFAAISPRPAAGLLRPVVRCPTFKYNNRLRAGRGFTLEELKQAGIPRARALSIGIAVDHRRRNKCLESLQANVQRLKEFTSKQVFISKKPEGGEPPAVAQLLGPILPISQDNVPFKARAITDEEKNVKAFQTMRTARADARLCGLRLRRAERAAAEEEMKKKKGK